MSIEKQISKLKKVLVELKDDKNIQARVTTVAAFETLADYKTRIFVKGQTADGGKIGTYSTKPFYAGKSHLEGLPKGRFNLKGKTGKSKFKNGKKHKSTYLRAGYKEFRKKAGRQSSKVDLNLTGASEKTIQIGTRGDSVAMGFTDAERMKILRANERRYRKDIFSLSQNESNTYQDAADREMQQLIKEILQTND